MFVSILRCALAWASPMTYFTIWGPLGTIWGPSGKWARWSYRFHYDSGTSEVCGSMRLIFRVSLERELKTIVVNKSNVEKESTKKKKTASHQAAGNKKNRLVSIDFASSLCERKNGHFFGTNPHCTAHFKGAIFGSTDLDHLHHLFLTDTRIGSFFAEESTIVLWEF